VTTSTSCSRARSLLALATSVALLAACSGGAAKTAPRPAVYVRGTTDAQPFRYDASKPLDAKLTPMSGGLAYTAHHVTYRSADGATVSGILTDPRWARAPHACVIVQHGLGGDKEDTKPFWNAAALADIEVLAIDARDHGERGTARDLRRDLADPARLRSALQGTVIDQRRGLDFLQRRGDCDPKRLGYIGISMGALLGAMLAGVDARVEAPVLVVGGGDWRSLLSRTDIPEIVAARRADPGFVQDAASVLAPIDPDRWVGKIAPRPVLMINGRDDSTVVPTASRALHAAAGDPKSVVWYSGGHHPSRFEEAKLAARGVEWIVRYLR
jgi:dienelactone hydrolase